MSLIVDRTCRELRETEGSDGGLAVGESEPLSAFRSRQAYVLLGDPGAGKTTEFRREQLALGDDLAVVVSARDFKTFDVECRPEWRNKTLFIDGLDETRVGETDSRTPLDKIRAQLARLGTPSFRLSCREADWLGSSDRQHLQAVSPDSEITVLRLDPLDADGTGALLRSQHQLDDVGEFMLKAHRNGVGAMLGNPLTLDLLADVVKQGGDWPQSRGEVLQKACRHLAGEQNDEHRVARLGLPRETVIDAAGYLCALVLLSGMEGCSLSDVRYGPGIVCLDDLGDPPGSLTRRALEHALFTKLFTTPETCAEQGALAPRHRQVAEFLGGLYLAKRIEGGLPARRVVALMTAPSDGRVVTALRGLSAWLAVYSRDARRNLIAADPVGVGLYGDIGRFDLAEQERLLEALPESLVLGEAHQDDTAWAFRSLASADMVPAMREMLGRVRDGTGDDSFAALILGTIEHAESPSSVAELAPDLMAVVCGYAVPSHLRTRALDAYLHLSSERDDREAALRDLLNAIRDDSVSDPDDDLRGTLLRELYPAAVGPSDVWNHLIFRNRADYLGRLWIFGKKTLLERSSDRDLAALLDALHENASEMVPALIEWRAGDLPLLLLERALNAHGESLEPDALCGWLAVASRASFYSGKGSTAGIRAWLEERPHIQKAVYLASLRHSRSDGISGTRPFRYSDVLHGSRPPADFGLWCLGQALTLADTEPDVAQELLSRAHASLGDPSTAEGLTVEIMQRETLDQPALAHRLDELLRPPRLTLRDEDYSWEFEERRQRIDEEQRQQREDWARYLRESETDLRENRFPPQNLHTLAKSYFGLFVEDDEDASHTQRVGDFVGGDQELVSTVLAALRGAVTRHEIPSVAETISLNSESRHSWMAYPVLAGLHLLDHENPERVDSLIDEQKRKVLAIYYCVPRPDDRGQRWHRRWLDEHPGLVLEVLGRCALARVRTGDDMPPGLDCLDSIADYDDQVHAVRLKLLRAFPARSTSKQMPVLDDLLARSLEHPDKSGLLALATSKQELKSLPVAQRIRWLTIEALISQGDRWVRLNTYIVGRETRTMHLAQFLHGVRSRRDAREFASSALRVKALPDVIEVLGRWCAPTRRSGRVTLKMETSDLVGSLIRELGSLPGDEAHRALVRLSEDPLLRAWHDHVGRALEAQFIVHREASYRHPGVDQVQSTLAGGEPANAADLAALLGHRLRDLSELVGGDNSNMWSRYWNEYSDGRPPDPKPENSCRDALLDALRLRLPADVDAAPEGAYVSDWRADIRATCRDFNIPIEIKRDRHRDLWRALRSQLIGQYTTDPATSGYGIYVVLWFGDGRVQTPPDGNRPRTPEELQQRLVQDLTQDERRKISVIVMDVSKPSRPSRSLS